MKREIKLNKLSTHIVLPHERSVVSKKRKKTTDASMLEKIEETYSLTGSIIRAVLEKVLLGSGEIDFRLRRIEEKLEKLEKRVEALEKR